MQIFLDQLVYFGAFQSCLLLFIYFFSPIKRKQINGYLMIMVAVLLFGLTGKVLYSLGIGDKNFRLIAMSEVSALLFGPTVFLFIKSTDRSMAIARKDLSHYLPAFFYSLFIFFYFVLATKSQLIERNNSGELDIAIDLCHGIGIVVNSVYWYAAYVLFRNFVVASKDEVSYEVRSLFLNRFLLIFGFCLLVWAFIFLASLFGQSSIERVFRPYIWILLTLIILFITYYSMVYPDVLGAISNVVKPQKYSQSKISQGELDQLEVKLNQLMSERKPYLEKGLMKSELAQMLGVNPPDLARLLNEKIGMNFFEYVNQYRVNEFISLVSSEGAWNKTIFGWAQEAGFSSKTTFNKAFKSFTGTSPSVYIGQKNEKEL